jgi:hypothetical protein
LASNQVFEKAPVAYNYKKGEDLLATQREIKELSTTMRQLHEYYKYCYVKAGQGAFGVLIPQIIVQKGKEEVHWVKFEALF